MPNVYSALYTHLVFSTKLRQPLLTADLRPRLFEYMGGICRNMQCSLISAGGIEDHVHLLVRRHPTKGESEILRVVKSNSSGWLKQFVAGFGWQDGGGAFSVGPGQLAVVTQYLASQVEHHRTKTFQEEYLQFLKQYEIEFDPEYVFE